MPSISLLEIEHRWIAWILLTPQYVESKTERCNGFINPKFGHDKSILHSVKQVTQLQKYFGLGKMDIGCPFSD